MAFDIWRFRTQWRELNQRVEQLERRVKESDGILNALLADAEYTPDPDLGLNGQHRRKEIVEKLFSAIGFDRVLETGTFLGATTGYFATRYGVPVFSSELMPRNHHFSRRFLRNLPNVKLFLKDSRSFLRDLSHDGNMTLGKTFFYLDAHWYDDLPLEDEINLIAEAWEDYVILIDDFQVLGDSGYLYDDYGAGKSLTVDYLSDAMSTHQLKGFFPKAPSAQETGKKRGSFVLASPSLASAVEQCELLRVA